MPLALTSTAALDKCRHAHSAEGGTMSDTPVIPYTIMTHNLYLDAAEEETGSLVTLDRIQSTAQNIADAIDPGDTLHVHVAGCTVELIVTSVTHRLRKAVHP